VGHKGNRQNPGFLWRGRKEEEEDIALYLFQIQVPEQVRAFFAMAVITKVGNDTCTRTLVWEDRWLHGQRIIDVAPRLHSLVAKKTIKKRKVAEALTKRIKMPKRGELGKL